MNQMPETDILKYKVTPFGDALFKEVMRLMRTSENKEALSKMLDETLEDDERKMA